MPDQQQRAGIVLAQPPKEAANDSGNKQYLRQYPTKSDRQYEQFGWARVALEEGVKARP